MLISYLNTCHGASVLINGTIDQRNTVNLFAKILWKLGQSEKNIRNRLKRFALMQTCDVPLERRLIACKGLDKIIVMRTQKMINRAKTAARIKR